MTFLLTLIVLLLITMVVWMTCMAMLYKDLVTGEKKFRQIHSKAITELFGELEDSREYTDRLNDELDARIAKLEESQDFATKTINQARRLIQEAKEEIKAELRQAQPEQFRYVEPEEDPEEPRS